ncbi:methyltransferase [Ignicoccus islandicus DSM 13165]|uniref:Methyltransferase n=1 Tax=Ignicoccus islandicus DSM 13165 TaxID=940295 RepID=A0A0U2U5M7_9CREN|nr:methyltransferase [Ignicoccus islandicus]ALU11476.1 methyltransferase [Ignicoccus islandicus DSM 13165]
MHYYKKGKGGRPIEIVLEARGVRLVLTTPPGLFSSSQIDLGTRLLIEWMEIPDKGKLLDIGCGYGPIGLFAKAFNPQLDVYMVDVNPQAVKASRRNAERNGLEVTVLQGNLYEPTDALGLREFSTIVSNPPLAAGKEVVESVIRGAPERLAKGGSLQMVFAKGGERAEELFKELFREVEVKRKKGYALVRGYL